MPGGGSHQLPALPKFPEGWQLDKPDLGADIYRN